MLQPQRQLLCLYATNIQPTNRFLGERVISHSAVVVAKTRAIRLFRKDFDGSLFPFLWDVSHHPCVDKLAVKATEGSCHSGEQAWEKLLFFLKMSRFEYLVLFTSSEKKKNPGVWDRLECCIVRNAMASKFAGTVRTTRVVPGECVYHIKQ